MAEVTVIPAVTRTEVVTVEEGHVSLKLSIEEATGLTRLLCGGTELNTLSRLGLYELMKGLEATEVYGHSLGRWTQFARFRGL